MGDKGNNFGLIGALVVLAIYLIMWLLGKDYDYEEGK